MCAACVKVYSQPTFDEAVEDATPEMLQAVRTESWRNTSYAEMIPIMKKRFPDFRWGGGLRPLTLVIMLDDRARAEGYQPDTSSGKTKGSHHG